MVPSGPPFALAFRRTKGSCCTGPGIPAISASGHPAATAGPSQGRESQPCVFANNPEYNSEYSRSAPRVNEPTHQTSRPRCLFLRASRDVRPQMHRSSGTLRRGARGARALTWDAWLPGATDER